MEKVKHNDRFFIINNESFSYRNSDFIKKETGEDSKYLQYQWVIPVYVYSICKVWNGEERFDLSPVDFSLPKNNGDNWRWKREYKYSDIGEDIFLTEKEALKIYNQKYSDESKTVFQELRRLRFIQEGKAELI